MTKYVTPVLVLVVAVLAVALFARGGEVLTALIISSTNSSAATVNVSNSIPTLGPVNCYDTDETTNNIDLVSGGTRHVWCNATFNDQNGIIDMVTFEGRIYTQTAGAAGANDITNRYVNNSCANTTLNATAYKVECSYNFWYNADNTSKTDVWHGNVTVVDSQGAENTTADDINVSELIAIGVDATLAFGTKTVFTNDSTTATAHTIYNYGNIEIDFQTNGTVLTCDTSQIDPEWLAANMTNGGEYAVSYFLTSTLGGPNTGNEFDIDLAESTDTSATPTATSDITYWGIGIPTGVQGDCEGVIWFGALAS